MQVLLEKVHVVPTRLFLLPDSLLAHHVVPAPRPCCPGGQRPECHLVGFLLGSPFLSIGRALGLPLLQLAGMGSAARCDPIRNSSQLPLYHMGRECGNPSPRGRPWLRFGFQ